MKSLQNWKKFNTNYPEKNVLSLPRQIVCEKYLIDTVPTVLLFELGTVTQRLDGEPGAGLSEQQLKKMLTES